MNFDPHKTSTSTGERNRRWAATMQGYDGPIRLAHADSRGFIGPPNTDKHLVLSTDIAGFTRKDREELENLALAPGATRSGGVSTRKRQEDPDPWRTCFEQDRDRILHASAFRRLSGKTQVFIFPEDHQRTRLTHALEVAQVATSIARACNLNVSLTEAIALGHDCGHGPGGHASEDALGPYLSDGFDHARWGADVSLSSLNLCAETLDGIRNHSWSLPAPSTPEGEVVSWADRIAYVCHDWEDAVRSRIVSENLLPEIVRTRCGVHRGAQLGTFITAVITTTLESRRVGMDEETAETLGAFRSTNYKHIYLREESLVQGETVIRLLRALVDYYSEHSDAIPIAQEDQGIRECEDPVNLAVTYVAGMTDRFAFRQAASLLGWDPSKLPNGIDISKP